MKNSQKQKRMLEKAMRMSAGSSKDGCVSRQETRGTPLLFSFFLLVSFHLVSKRDMLHAKLFSAAVCTCSNTKILQQPFALSSSFSTHHRRKHSCAYFNRTKSCVFCPLCLKSIFCSCQFKNYIE